MQIEIVQMTPATAKTLLGRNDNNRHLQETRIGLMAAQMRQGTWQLNGETIIISDTGRLLDGQHRLAAVIVSGATVPMLVATGASDQSFETINTGRSRKVADIVGISGQRNRSEVAASATQLWKVVGGFTSVTSMPPQYAVQIIDRYPSLDGWVERYRHARGVRSLIGAATIIPACVYLSDIAKRPELAGSLMDGIEKGANLAAGDPILALRNRLINLKARSVNMSAQNCWSPFARTVDAMEAGESVFQVQAARSTQVAQPKRLKAHMRKLDDKMKMTDLVPALTPGRIRDQADIVARLLKA